MKTLLSLCILLGANSIFAADDSALPPKAALEAITPDDLLKHIKVLASDEFEGRAPGSKGEELSVKYIAEQFKNVGLKPGNPNGSYVQEVPLAGITTAPTASLKVGESTTDLKFPDDYVASSAQLKENIAVENSDIVFVGYGIVAPEYGWDDYKDVDVKGKTILMLINDPAIPDPNDPSKLDDNMFKGRAMTYYGRWSYKYEIAAEKGAAAAIIIHETEPAAYPYSVVITSWSKENFEIDRPNKNMDQLGVRSWVTLDVAKKLLADSGQDFDALKQAAISKDFRPVPLGATANFNLKQEVRSFKSDNVVGKIDGSDPKLKDEWIVYTAHWDHLGKHPDVEGDQIFNGAVDNATGVAGLIELARAHRALKQPTKRSVLFIATTAEEAGLLGAKYYAENPLYPLEKTLADINMDGLAVWGKTRDIEDTSNGNSTLDDMLAAAAQRHGKVMNPNSQPEKGSFYRADQFEFSKFGVPSLYTGAGRDVIDKPPGFGQQKKDEFVAEHYHQPSDEVDPAWDVSGGAQDVQLLFEVGYQVANGDKWPEWKPGNEFKARRDESLKSRR
ncbi:MAG TPA: M20/M25/M40 family metallo-hydrolase [Chthoniobacterales bacterium]|nr:M20/M25/M40 family metallo-hydrolase [Chthoniobacterales bacterium]